MLTAITLMFAYAIPLIVVFTILYFVVKAAVRNGIREARRDEREA